MRRLGGDRLDRAPDGAPTARRAIPGLHHELRALAALEAEQRRGPEHRAAGRRRCSSAQTPAACRLRLGLPPTSTRPGRARRRADSRAGAGGRARPSRKPSESCAAAWRSARASGSSAWTITRPPRGPRPLRPASCATSAKVRSSARKSGKRSVESASSTTPRVTSGKSWPLATICVPTSTPARARRRSARSTVRDRAAAGRGVRVEPEHGQRRASAPRSRARAARCRRRGGPPTPIRSPGSPTAPARGGRSGGRRSRPPTRWSTSVDVALRAAPTRVRRPRQREEVGPAAAVQQHDRLLLAAAHRLERLARALVERAAHAQHRHDLDRRQRRGRPRARAASRRS